MFVSFKRFVNKEAPKKKKTPRSISKNKTGAVFEKFLADFSSAKTNYKKQKDITILKKDVEAISAEFYEYFGIGDVLLGYGEELFSAGDREAGIAVFKILEKYFENNIANQTLLFVRLAEFEFNKGNTDAGKDYLLSACRSIDNFEESIQNNELEDVWEKYRHYVENEISHPASNKLLAPDECSQQMDEIIKLPQDELLFALSEHLAELSANGNKLDLLSEQELNVYLVDEFVVTINSDGLENYFDYCAPHFIGLCSALEQIGCTEAQELWNKIKDKISQAPINDPKFEKALLHLADRDVNFENEEAFYYKKVERKLFSQISQYVKNNLDSFR